MNEVTKKSPSSPPSKTDSPQAEQKAQEQAFLLISELLRQKPGYCSNFEAVEGLPATRAILASSPRVQARIVLETLEIIAGLREKLGPPEGRTIYQYWNLSGVEGYPKALACIARRLFRKKLPFAATDLLSMVRCLARLECVHVSAVPLVENVVALLEKHRDSGFFTTELRDEMDRLQLALNSVSNAPEQKLRRRINALLAISTNIPMPPTQTILQAGEAWSDAAISELKAMSIDRQSAWLRLLAHCQGASGGSPSSRWLKIASTLLREVGRQDVRRRIQAWLPLVNEPRTQPITDWNPEHQPNPNELIIESHADILKGLAWLCGLREDKQLARALAALALSCYRKIPAKGPREVKVGNACVTALGMMPGMEGVYQLALLKVKVKFGTAQKFIEKALNTTAKRLGILRHELEEIAVPAYALTDVGRCAEHFGEYTAELTVTGSDSTAIAWIKADGKKQQSIPAEVKEKFRSELKDLQSAANDIQRMLPAQRERIDNLFREQKTWAIEVWRERYLDHPLIGVLARRLIWEFTSGTQTTAGIFLNGALVDLDLKPLGKLGTPTSVQLWHPIGKETEEIVAWRSWLEAQRIQQPFKQAHREVYPLTDAERRTRTYSNRFAAHILRQHQFNALCAARGWKNRLRLMVDAEFPPATVYLPKWNLLAEFWVEGVGEDYGTDTNDSGVFFRLSTDQVRFYRMDALQRTAHAGGGGYHASVPGVDAEPVPMEEVPPLVFSEVMRDVDLFVGVASIGNDPTWSDGGSEGRYRDYWQSYSFGELNATAKTRREVLERLVPRLKIAGQCSVEEKFLVVKGSLRTYKIHLGSGNILMRPNDQYLCIVPRQNGADEAAVLLPFEGDRTLSIILSKAFFLAQDAKIKDPTITHQLHQA